MTILEHKDLRATQTFEIPRLIESSTKSIDTTIACREMIDNALEETSPGEIAEVIITLDKYSSRATFENRNTDGMNEEEMKKYLKWGNLSESPSLYREHGTGGKLGLIRFCDKKKKGSVTITSKPRRSRNLFRMRIENWWQNLRPGKEFDIDDTEGEYESAGWTRFEVENADPKLLPLNVDRLADELGQTYGKMIGKKLNITLRTIQKSGDVKLAEVVPSTIPISEPPMGEETFFLGRKTKCEVTWGLIDSEKRDKEEKDRKGRYKPRRGRRVLPFSGDSIYYYVNDRLIRIDQLKEVNIPGHTGGHSLRPFVIIVETGSLSRTILKDDLESQTKQEINKRVAGFVKKDVVDLLKEADTSTIQERYARKTKIANEAFADTWTKMFNENLSEFAETFSLPTRGSVYSSEKKTQRKVKVTKPKQNRVTSLPGTRTVTGREGGKVTRKDKTKKGEIGISPIPEFRIDPFCEAIYPRAVLAQDKSSIELNNQNPEVAHVLRQKGKSFVAGMLKIGGHVLLREINIQAYEYDAKKYADAMERDLADFLAVAKKLGKI